MFLRRFSAQQGLRFNFYFFQRRNTTHGAIATAFGNWWPINGNWVAIANALHPGDQQRQNAAHLTANIGQMLEASMMARVHPVFTCVQYLQSCNWPVLGNQQMLDQNALLPASLRSTPHKSRKSK